MADSHDRVAAFIKTMGRLQNFTLVERGENTDGASFRYRVEYSGMTLFLDKKKKKDGIISGFSLQPE